MARFVAPESNLALLLQLAPDPMLVAEPGGAIVACNPQLESLFGYDAGELVGQPIDCLIPPELRERHAANLAGYLADPVPRMMGDGEFRAWRRDGEAFYSEISLSPLRDERGLLIVAAIRDVSRRKLVERQLQEAREQLHLVFAVSPEPYLLLSPEGELETCNPAAEQLFGDRGRIGSRHRHIGDLMFGGEHESDVFLRQLRECRQNGRVVHGEAVVSPPGKGSFDAEYTLAPLTDGDRSLDAVLLICRDISHRKQAQLNVLAAKERAEAALRELKETQFQGRLAQLVFGHGGHVDKFLGDGLMAVFSNVTGNISPCSSALRCGRHMLRDLSDFFAGHRFGAGEVLGIRIGAHYGPVLVGNIGDESRLELATIGDAVNIAARLEALGKTVGARFLASERLVRQAREDGGIDGQDEAALGEPLEQEIRGISSGPLRIVPISG